MQHVSDAQSLETEVTAHKSNQKKIALVPTMGNLHEGHLSLIQLAKQHADVVATSIYVNPSQFGPDEDFDQYPRTLNADKAKLAQAGADILFTPNTETMYPLGLPMRVQIQVPELSSILCGASRPGHFDGVATLVARLFHLIQPDVAIFGKKDFQQLRVIETMCKGLGLNISIIGAPIQRETDSLAMSSRNQYLSAEERQQATFLYKTLTDAVEDIVRPSFEFSEKRIQSLCDHAELYLADQGFISDYFSLRRVKDLQPAAPEDRFEPLVLMAAAYMGTTRLIDNLAFSMPNLQNKANQ